MDKNQIVILNKQEHLQHPYNTKDSVFNKLKDIYSKKDIILGIIRKSYDNLDAQKISIYDEKNGLADSFEFSITNNCLIPIEINSIVNYIIFTTLDNVNDCKKGQAIYKGPGKLLDISTNNYIEEFDLIEITGIANNNNHNSIIDDIYNVLGE